MRPRPTVFLADDHAHFCETIEEELRREFQIAGSAHDGQSAVAKVERLKPDVVVLDVTMPLLTGIDTAMRIRECVPAARILFVAIGQDANVTSKALRIGALGFLVMASSASKLPELIWNVFDERGTASDDGRPAQLTTREREVVQLLAQGKLMKQVATQLNVSTRTVAFHKYGVMRKLGLRSSAELVRLAVSEGLVA